MEDTGCDCVTFAEQRVVENYQTGDTVCTTCACVVHGHRMDQQPEWYDDTSGRAAGPGRLDDFLGPMGGAVVTTNKRLMEPDSQKNLRAGLLEVERCAGLVGLPTGHTIVQSAQQLYTDYYTARKAAGRTVRETERTVSAACAVYFGCKSHESSAYRHPRSVKEISGHCRVSVQEVTEHLKSFKTYLASTPYAKLLFTSVNAEDLLTRAIDGLQLDIDTCKVRQKALDILQVIKARDLLEGRTPETVCSAALYKACESLNIKVPKKAVHTACGVSNVTLNKALSDLGSL